MKTVSSDAKTEMQNLMRVRASLTGEDVVVRFAGEIHAMLPGERAKHLFSFDGFNIARAVEADGGYDLLAREAVFYLDPQTKECLDTWTSPFDEKTRDVLHVWNDPVNFEFRFDGPYGPFRMPFMDMGTMGVMTSDIFLTYPSTMPRAAFPANSQSDLYQAAELFQYYFKTIDLEQELDDVPMTVSWTRIAPWVPFMGMGDRPGQLVYHCSGTKVEGGFDALPDWMRAKIDAEGPEYATAPREMSKPNETSWSYFKKIHPEGTS